MNIEKNQKEALKFIDDFFNEMNNIQILSLTDFELYNKIKDIYDFACAVYESYILQKTNCQVDVIMTDKMYNDFCDKLYDLVIRKIGQIIYTKYKDFDLQNISNYNNI